MGTTVAYRADCASCRGLCCVGLTLTRSADFAIDKPAGVPCPNLTAHDRCRIHADLIPFGFPGCVRYDCFGAGQRLSAEPAPRATLAAALPIARQLQELRCYVDQAIARGGGPALAAAAARLDDLIDRPAARLAELDPASVRDEIAPLLREVSDRIRAAHAAPTVRTRPGVDLADRDLRGVSFRNALLIAADLRGADLRDTDLLGADVRDARVAGADLSTALFLGQHQVNGLHGDASTRLPTDVVRPEHWEAR